ncbi:hypothetical protein ACVIJW_003354 [Bradyrhizobium barranii subsp. barranii]
MAVSTNERPMCPVCKHQMALARISPGPRGFDERTFEYSTCERTEVVRSPGSDENGRGRLARR